MNSSYLIVGLGNPGDEFEKTRHNIGFELVDLFAKKCRMEFKKKKKFQGVLAQGEIDRYKIYLLKPLTFMNHSGHATRLCMDFLGIDLSHLLVVVDDIALPFGKLRLRKAGGTGGHKGLESVEHWLGTKQYSRLRIGIGDRKEGDLAEYVLEKFLPEEREALTLVLEKAIQEVELWMKQSNEKDRED